MLKSLQQIAIQKVIQAIDYAEENNLTNNQDFLNFLDLLNSLSVKY